MTNQRDKIWAVVPAAGVGSRMGLEIPKQYLNVAGKPIIQHTLELLLGLDQLAGVMVSISCEDHWFSDLNFNDERVSSTVGGSTRAISVLNGLNALDQSAAKQDWVLVHDAARPCLSLSLLQDMVETIKAEPVGGIMAIKAKDTLKQAKVKNGVSYINNTVDRSAVWQAQTPQMIRYGELKNALNYCLDNNIATTDEASALEQLGRPVRLFEGSADNIKVTTPEDQKLAEFVLGSL